MNRLMIQLATADEVTREEVRRFAEQKLDEATKIRGQIAKDLRRLGGEYAFRHERNYRTLREKYQRGHQGRKKLALLEMERRAWAKEREEHE